MDFELSSEQVMLRDTARRLLSERWTADDARNGLDAPPTVIPDALWKDLVDMGWLGVGIAEDGSADTLTAAVLAEEVGRAVLPGPLLSSLIAISILNRGGTDLVDDAVTGRHRYALAIDEPGGLSGPDAVTLRADGGSLAGRKLPVMDAATADAFLVACRQNGDLALSVVPASAVSVSYLQRLDAQSVGEVVLSDVSDYEVLPSGDLVANAYDVAAVLTAASLLGSSQLLVEMTAQYATERRQFGRSIGSFQAVSHRIANMLVDVEIGRGLVYGACVALDEIASDAPLLVSGAKAWMSEAAVSVAEASIQLHGGIGYTWETDVHLHLRRARSDSVLWGDVRFHHDRVAALRDRIADEGRGMGV